MSPPVEFLAFNPVIPTKDMGQALEFYNDQLGFRKVFDDAGPAGGEITYAGVRREGLCFHLQAMVEGQGGAMPLIRVRVEGIEQLHQEYVESGAVADQGPLEPTAWGTREFGIWDPNGAGFVFYEDP